MKGFRPKARPPPGFFNRSGVGSSGGNYVRANEGNYEIKAVVSQAALPGTTDTQYYHSKAPRESPE
jgi:hypothetical protein